MAEALARHRASEVIAASIAGIAPLGVIAESTRAVLKERDVRMDGQYSKRLNEEESEAADLIVNMTGRPGEALFAGSKVKVEDWDVGDPYGEDLAVYRQICDEIEARLADLAERLRQQQAESNNT
jgi:arsenate reductase